VFASELFIPTLVFLFSITDPPSRFGIFQPLATLFPLSWSFIGNSRMRLPVAAKMALQNAAIKGGTPGSPTPAGGALLSTIYTFV
jgi:hypothetical protein